MAQQMINKQENSGTKGPDQDITAKDQKVSKAADQSAPNNPTPATPPSGIKVQVASAGG